MCSSPKSACSSRPSRARRPSKPADYQAYASMMREASANFERIQALKEEKRPAAAGKLVGQDTEMV